MEILKVQGNIITYKSKLGITKTKKLKGLNKKPYFLDGVFDEKVFVNLDTLQVLKQEENDGLKRFSFEVEYEHNGRANGFAHTVKTVEAKTYEDALDKVKKSFKNIFDIAEA